MALNNDDFVHLGYCGICCEMGCDIFAATRDNDMAAKAQIAERWTKKFNKSFKPEDVFCYGCKNEDAPLGQSLKACTIRNCATGKNLSSCACCNGLESCNKDLWVEWPGLKDNLRELKKIM